ncbi:MAG TPA: ATP-binding protein [Kofleriaceae bacterium]|nr:ATP-binding protein [Kofleriaceae bacterium]
MSSFLDEVLGYVGLEDGDREKLRGLHGRLAPHFPDIASTFYDAVWKNAGAAAVLSGPEQIERLRVTLIDWMSTGLLGPYDERFYDKRSRIGRRHVAIGLAQQYMFTAMNVVRGAYHDRIAQLMANDDPADRRATHRAVDKLLDIELAIMVRHYQLDSEDKLVARERRILGDRLTAMQTLSAGLAHEVRNPLNAAKLQLELLERRLIRQGADDPRLIEPCELAQKEIERLTELLNDFLAFARPPELHTQEQDIAALLRQVVDLERIDAERRGADLALASPDKLLAHVDPSKIKQLVLNLVRNAIEAVPRGGHVAVELAGDHDEMHIRVSDDGPGIPETVRPRIYEPFFSTKEGGTGLGMSIVHSLVALHGGTIDFVTSPRGTQFEVTLPRRP